MFSANSALWIIRIMPVKRRLTFFVDVKNVNKLSVSMIGCKSVLSGESNKKDIASKNGQAHGLDWKWVKKQQMSKEKLQRPQESLENYCSRLLQKSGFAFASGKQSLKKWGGT